MISRAYGNPDVERASGTESEQYVIYRLMAGGGLGDPR